MPDLEEELRKLLSTTSGSDALRIDAAADLVQELGLDSLTGLRVLAAVEKQFDVRFPDHRLEEFRTLRQLIDFIEIERP